MDALYTRLRERSGARSERLRRPLSNPPSQWKRNAAAVAAGGALTLAAAVAGDKLLKAAARAKAKAGKTSADAGTWPLKPQIREALEAKLKQHGDTVLICSTKAKEEECAIRCTLNPRELRHLDSCQWYEDGLVALICDLASLKAVHDNIAFLPPSVAATFAKFDHEAEAGYTGWREKHEQCTTIVFPWSDGIAQQIKSEKQSPTGSHWILVVLATNGAQPHMRIHDSIAAQRNDEKREKLFDEVGALLRPFGGSWCVGFVDSQTQDDGHSCGPIVCQSMLMLAEGKEPNKINFPQYGDGNPRNNVATAVLDEEQEYLTWTK